MTAKALGYGSLPSLAIARGATTPDPSITGVMVWSTSAAEVLVWDGSVWNPPAGFFSEADKTKLDLLNGYDYENAESFLGRPSIGSSSLPTGIGVTYAGAGTAGSNLLLNDGGGVLSARPRCSRSTTSSAGTLAEFYTLGGFLWGATGYHYVKDFGFSTTTNARIFAGLSNSVVALTNVSMESLINIIGVGRKDGSPNMHMLWNGPSGTAYSIDLGASYPISGVTNQLYRLTLDASPGGATVNMKIEKLSGTYAGIEALLNNNLPTQYIPLADKLFGTNRTDAAIVTLQFGRMTAMSRPV